MEKYQNIMSKAEMEEVIEEKNYEITDLKLDLQAKDVKIERLQFKLDYIVGVIKKLDESNPLRIEILDYLENAFPPLHYEAPKYL